MTVQPAIQAVFVHQDLTVERRNIPHMSPVMELQSLRGSDECYASMLDTELESSYPTVITHSYRLVTLERLDGTQLRAYVHSFVNDYEAARALLG